jgi:transcriptional regulator with XRE-family HTH domain
MCKESKVSRGSLTDLKNGRTKSLSAKAVSQIADYFGVSSDYFIKNNTYKVNPIDLMYIPHNIGSLLDGGLTENEEKILSLFRQMTETQQGRLIERAEIMLEND